MPGSYEALAIDPACPSYGHLGRLSLERAKVDQAQVSRFVVGQTTYDQIVAALGQPNAVAVAADGRRAGTYSYVHEHARPETFIPVIGAFVGGADATAQSVTFVFDQSGVL